jgi:Fe-S-cluster-containing hydrogenase component 2
MAMKIIQSECSSCGDCVPVCPTKSIVKKGELFKINKDTCTECEDEDEGPRCVAICDAGEACIIYI